MAESEALTRIAIVSKKLAFFMCYYCIFSHVRKYYILNGTLQVILDLQQPLGQKFQSLRTTCIAHDLGKDFCRHKISRAFNIQFEMTVTHRSSKWKLKNVSRELMNTKQQSVASPTSSRFLHQMKAAS